MLSYANIQDRIEQLLQDTSNATYDTTELGMAIENEIKRLSRYSPFIVDCIYKIESREGSDTAGTASKLTDTTKAQFLSTDPTYEKVVHNITDDTWAVVTAYTSTSVLSIGRNIMASGEEYEIYNKRCVNKRQIYLGDLPSYLWIVSVEYPVGVERGFLQVSRDVIELDVSNATIEDSDSTLTTLESVDVLVKLAVTQILSQLTDWAGELTADAAAGATSIAIDGMGATETIEVGDVFYVQNQRSAYVVSTAVTMAAGAGTVSFYPPLEAAASNNDDVTFVKSSLQPNEEDLLERMVVSRAVQSDSIRSIKAVNLGGPQQMANYQRWITGNPLLNPISIQRELESLARPSMRGYALPRGAVSA